MKNPKKPTIFHSQPSSKNKEKNAANEQMPVEMASKIFAVCIPMNLPNFRRNDFAEFILHPFTFYSLSLDVNQIGSEWLFYEEIDHIQIHSKNL